MAAKQKNAPGSLVVIGTSAGGIHALGELVSQLDADMDAAFMVVMHLSRKGIGDFLLHLLGPHTSLPIRLGADGDPVERGIIYVAPPDRHLLVEDGHILLGRGPAENRWRPSVNNLFRSAAASYGERTVGIVLTGMLDDGTSGMSAIRRSGGTCIVQDPNEAEFPDMPMSVLNNMEVDYCLPLAGMGGALRETLQQPLSAVPQPIPEDVRLEAFLDRRVSTGIQELKGFDSTDFNCPDCGGNLYLTTADHPTHYRCYLGHSYTDRELLIRQTEELEATLWTALRMMEERRSLLVQLSAKDARKGLRTKSSTHEMRAEELRVHIDRLRAILHANQKPE